MLLVSGEPHAGERTWRNLLKSDASVDLVHFTILRPPEKQDGTPINELSLIAFPTRELFQQKISEFNLIIFDRYARQGVLPIIYFDNIARYVRDGGAVLVAAGPDYASPTSIWRTPLDVILPADGSTLNERRRIGYGGLITVAVPVGDNGNLAGKPLVRPFGVPVEEDRDDFIADATDAATRAFSPGGDEDKMREAVRLAVRRCATLWTGKKPLVEVMLLQVAQ